jgi:hypothetical protein
MATLLEEFITEEHCPVVRLFYCGQKDSMQKILIKKYILFMVGSVCRVKHFHLCGKRFPDDKEVETERRSGSDLHAPGFDALVKRWNKGIDVGAYLRS